MRHMEESGCERSVADVGERCCGCLSCASICPKGCISVVADGMGFRHPSVNADVCVSCALCRRVCPALSGRKKEDSISCRWVMADNADMLASSSSGGAFGLLANRVLEAGGSVYGAAFDDGFRAVRHVRAASFEEFKRLHGSKYVQSVVDPALYREVERDLKSGLHVLWSGTPCQASACRGYLEAKGADVARLLCVDVICHGVPSPRVWSNWLDWYEEKVGSPLVAVNFRSKETGWPGFSMAYAFENGERSTSRFESDWYCAAFNSNRSLRNACFACPARRHSGSDITLGDFWGFPQSHPDVDCRGGVSAVLANTDKGERAVKDILAGTTWGAVDYMEIYAGNPSLEVNPKRPEDWNEFRGAVSTGESVDTLMAKWAFKPSVARRVKDVVFGAVKRVLGPRLVQRLQSARFARRAE